jgi:hypothetical protein
MTINYKHYYALPANKHCLCACGHAEPFEDNKEDFDRALVRMNTHIRTAYTAEEWEVRMQNSKTALFSPENARLKIADEA